MSANHLAALQDVTYRQALDSLLIDQTARIRAARNVSVPSDSESIISIPAARICFIQHCTSPLRTGVAANIASDTSVELDVKGLALRTQKARELDESGHCDGSQFLGLNCDTISLRGEQNLTKANVQLGRSDGSGKPQADLHDNLRFEIVLSGASLEKSSNRLGDLRAQLQVDSFTCLGGSLSPVLMCVIVMSWNPHIQAAMQPLPKRSGADLMQTAISRIVEGVDYVKDPQCLTSRFELLRHRDVARLNSLSATHVNVAAREDPGWLALTYLRVAMSQRELDHAKVKDEITSDLDIASLVESNREAISKWRKHNLFHAMVETIPFLQSTAPSEASESLSVHSKSKGGRRLISGSVAALELRLRDQRRGAQVDLIVFTLTNAVIVLLQDTASGTQHVDERNAHCDVGSCRVETHVYLLDRLQDVAPSVTDTLNSVKKSQVNSDKRSSPDANGKERITLPYLTVVQVKDMVISAIAAPLLVEMTVSDLQLMIKKSSTDISGIPEMVNLLSANTRARLLSVHPRHGLSPTYLSLVSLEFDTTRLSICNARHSQQSQNPRASIIVYAGHVLVHTRATPHIMHARIQEWLDDYKRSVWPHYLLMPYSPSFTANIPRLWRASVGWGEQNILQRNRPPHRSSPPAPTICLWGELW